MDRVEATFYDRAEGRERTVGRDVGSRNGDGPNMQVPVAFDELQSELNLLIEALGILRAKLGPVLIERPEPNAKGQATPQDRVCGLAGSVYAASGGVRIARIEVESMIDGLQL